MLHLTLNPLETGFLIKLRRAKCPETLDIMTDALEREYPKEHTAIAKAYTAREIELRIIAGTVKIAC